MSEMRVRPLDRIESFRTITNMFRPAGDIVVAAPYFGEGAATQLGLGTSTAKITVVCDLFSGGCNPREIMRIARLPSKPTLKRLTGLHAKIYLCENGVVIGSANPSSNGLGFEGKELEGNVEACVHSNDPEIVAAWRAFVETQVLPHALTITPSDIQRATDLYRVRRAERIRGEERTLLEVMQKDRDHLADKPIYFAYYSRVDTSSIQDQAIEDRNAALGTDNISAYFDWVERPEPGSYIVDFQTDDHSSRGRYGGIWRVVEKDHIITLGKSTAIFVYPVDDIQGLTIPPGDQKFLRKMIERNSGVFGGLPTAYEVSALAGVS